jgi:hypothetical protein
MECENNNPPGMKGQIDQFDTLEKIVNQLRSANYYNDEGYLACNVAFKKLEELAKEEMLPN